MQGLFCNDRLVFARREPRASCNCEQMLPHLGFVAFGITSNEMHSARDNELTNCHIDVRRLQISVGSPPLGWDEHEQALILFECTHYEYN